MVNSRERHTYVEKVPNTSPVVVYFKEVIYGGIDGIITTFAVVAGFSGAAFSNEATTQLSFLVVLLFGLANLFADGVSMGLGNFLSVRSDQTQFRAIRARACTEIADDPDTKVSQTVDILTQKGFREADAEMLASIYRKNNSYWVDFIMHHKLQIPDSRSEKPLYTGLATFTAFILFGSIPLMPFAIFTAFEPGVVFFFSSLGTLTALILLGVLKWKVVGTKPLRSVFEVVVIGTMAALVAFTVGSLFKL